LIFDLGHSDWVDDMGDDSGRPVLADFGLESGPSGRELMHLAQSRETHVFRDRSTDRIGPHGFSLIVYGLGCRDSVHAHGPVILRLDLLDCAIKSHYLNPNQISESDFIGARPNAAAIAPIAPRTSALPVLSGTKILTAAPQHRPKPGLL
jgi:hypothetical protein